MPVRLENWAVHLDQGGYRAPETCMRYLSGEVFGHPRFEEGKKVSTGHLVGFPFMDDDHWFVKTRRTVYQLGKPSPEYLAWLDENGHTFDPNEPIKARIR